MVWSGKARNRRGSPHQIPKAYLLLALACAQDFQGRSNYQWHQEVYYWVLQQPTLRAAANPQLRKDLPAKQWEVADHLYFESRRSTERCRQTGRANEFHWKQIQVLVFRSGDGRRSNGGTTDEQAKGELADADELSFAAKVAEKWSGKAPGRQREGKAS